MVRKLPSFRGIEAFLHVVEEGGLRAAARSMNLGVSAVSYRIRVLEEEIGVPLFERDKSQLRLTTDASRFHEEIKHLAFSIQEATQRLASTADNALRLSISVARPIHLYWLQCRLVRLWQRLPELQIDIHSPSVSFDTHSQEDKHLLGVDLTIHSRFAQHAQSDHPNEIRLFDWDVLPICRPELVAEHDLRTPEDLAKVRLINVHQPLGAWRHWLSAVGLPADFGKSWLLVDGHELMMEAAMHGLGVSIGTRCMAKDYFERGLVFPFDQEIRIPGGCFVSGPVPGERPVVTDFRDWLIEEGRRSGEQGTVMPNAPAGQVMQSG